MPPSKNLELYSNWVLLKEAEPPPVTAKVVIFNVITDPKDQYACKWCDKPLVEHATHFRKHLSNCNKYINATKSGKIQATGNPFNFHVPVRQEANQTNRNQTQLNMPTLTSQQKKEIDVLAAMWCYLGNLPFNVYESAIGKRFVRALHPAYKAPSRKTISGPLLDKVYDMTKTQSDRMLSSLDTLNVVTDESSNIRSSRICNISVLTPSGSVHYISEDIQAKQMNATAAVQWLRTHLLALANGDPSRINSIITDTCALMFAMLLEMQQMDEFKHVFFVPCDSHGIQLLVKDLLEIPVFKDIMAKVQTVVKSFRRSLLQYARLREFQLQYNKQHRSLILSVITRWGTQYRLIRSLLESKDALKRYAHEFGDLPANKRLKQTVIDILRDRGFWLALEPLRELLQPLDEALKMSESGNSHLGHVLPRWITITEHLKMRQIDYPDELVPF